MVNFFNNEYFVAVFIVIIFVIFSKIFFLVFKKYIKKFASKTKTDIDDVIVEILEGPSHFFFIFIGIYIAGKSLSILEIYDNIIRNFFFVGVVIIITLIIVKVIDFLIVKWLKVNKKFEKTPKLINGVVNFILYLIGIIIILEHFNIKLTPIIATLGVGALAVGLALQNTLSNFFAGLHIISDKPINVGDFIELDSNVSGHVEDISWRSTRLRTGSNNIVIIPNAKLADSIITNYTSSQKEMTISVQCGVSYNENLEKV